MAYPDDQTTFRRVTNQELPSVPGDTVDEGDQNNMADFCESLQDILGYGITMGYASVKAFFDWIVATITGVKKNNIITLYQNVNPVIIAIGEVQYFGGSLSLLATDKVILQANVLWKTPDAVSGNGFWAFVKWFNSISPLLQPETFKQNTMMSTTFTYIIQTPDAGTADYKFKIDNRVRSIRVEQISVIATIISV